MHISLRGYSLILITLLAAIYAQWSSIDIDMIWRVMAATVILLLTAELYTSRLLKLAAKSIVDQHAFLGRKSHGTVLIRNNSRLPVQLMIEQPLPADSLGDSKIYKLKIPQRNFQQLSISWTPQRLGAVEWQPLYIRIRGLFGLAWWNRLLNPYNTFEVLPDYLHSHERQPGLHQTGTLSYKTTGNGSELLQLREYQSGDSLRSIDWKATARSGKHIVRVFTEEQHLDIIIMIDAGRTSAIQAGNLSRFHHYVNVASRLAQYAVSNNDQIGFVLFADSPICSMPPSRGISAIVKMREQLKKSSTLSRESNSLAAVIDIKRWLKHRSLIIIFTDLDTGDNSSQIVKATSLLAPKHVPVIASIKDESTVALSQKRAVHKVDTYYSLAALELLETEKSTAMRLQRLGAYVVQSVADKLDNKILRLYQNLKQRRRI